MAKTKKRKFHKNIQIAFQRLLQTGGALCRQFSESAEAIEHGGNYIYFTVRDNTKFPTGAGRFLIENGLCVSGGDGLFEDTPQTFKAVPRDRFEEFKQNYEAAPNA